MDVQEVLADLTYNTGSFPQQALQEAAANREQMTPFLLKIIEESGQLPAKLDEENYMAHIYAMYLLSLYREKLAYPLIVDFFSLPDEIVMDSTGDVVTEDLHSILASVAHGDTSLIKSLVKNEKANEYIRGAALEAALTQMVQGEITREELVAYYQSLFQGGLKREPSNVWDDLVWYSSDIYPEELIGDIRQAYDEELINNFCISIEDVEKTLARGKEGVLRDLYHNSRHRFIENVIDDISWWACFTPPKPSKLAIPEKYQPAIVHRDQPMVAPKKIGRNEPRPCGRGKKYKKCCGK
jgi:hypothetical protein